MAPVSRKQKPSRSATARATLLLPAPAGPSMVTIIFVPSGATPLCLKLHPFITRQIDGDFALFDAQLALAAPHEIVIFRRRDRAQGSQCDFRRRAGRFQ